MKLLPVVYLRPQTFAEAGVIGASGAIWTAVNPETVLNAIPPRLPRATSSR